MILVSTATVQIASTNCVRHDTRRREPAWSGQRRLLQTAAGTAWVGQPFEVFLKLGEVGESAMAYAEAIGRLTSLALRSGLSLQQIHRQLRGISSDRAVGLGPNKALSLPDAVGIALEQRWRERQGGQQNLLTGGQSAAVQAGPSLPLVRVH